MTEVFLQCITENKDPADPNNTYWELTTEFCYVRSADFFQSPEGDCEFEILRARKKLADVLSRLQVSRLQ